MRTLTKISCAIFVLVLSVATAFGDNEIFNYTPEGKNYYTLSTSQILIKFKKDLTFAQKQSILASEKAIIALKDKDVLPAPDVTIARVQGMNDETLYALLERLQANPSVDYANPFLVYEDGTLQGIQDRVIVRLKSRKDLQTLRSYAKRFNLSIADWDDYDPNIYILQTNKNSIGNALEVANALYETQAFDWAEPDFLLLLKRFNTNDTYLNYQWSLNNTGSGIQYNGTPGADMNVFDAWGVTNGSSSIKVAIIDEGVDLNHPDLQANLLSGYDATGQGSGGGPSGDDAHGTSCAGIVAAVGNNNQGVAGVAYSCKIIPVRIAYGSGSSWVTSNSWIGNAINWAWSNAGADVLSNSWGGGGNSSTINNAISGAVNSGRNGLGAPVMFAAGNDNGAVSYPATQTNTIAVAAMSMCYERKSPSSCDGETWWGSNYGTNVDVAAPGVKIYTTDISGSDGYSSGNYVSNFNGTSSATPNAAGVMALILSANPSLTQTQARYAMESTCRKVGSYTYNSGVSGQPNGTWSTSLGYGLVDAHQAVLSVAPQIQDDAGVSGISSPNGSICSSTINPSVTLSNYGSNTLNSATINYQVDNGSVSTYNWTGSLASTNSTVINLPAVNISSGSHTFNAYTTNPNGNSDGNSGNDGASSSFTSGSNPVTLTIVLDNYGSETTWEVRNGSNQVVASGGPYSNGQNGTIVTSNFCLADGCFDFIIYDSYGDGICCGYGQGSYQLVNDLTSTALASGGSFNSSQTTNFCVQSTVPLSAAISSSSNVSCNSGNDGSASVSASGGTTPYSYLWSNGATSSLVSGLVAGTYIVTVTDNSSNTATASVTISQPSALNASVSSGNVSCNGGNSGSVNVSVLGGASPYSYAWSNGATSQNLSGLSVGTYGVTVTDANGCTTTASASVTQPSALVLFASGSNVNCGGGNDGSVNLSVSGGAGSYSYNWSNGSQSQNLSNVIAGSYFVTVTDANGCTATAAGFVSEPDGLSLSTSASPSSCGTANDGSVDLSVSGGTVGYIYAWSNGATTEDLNGLAEGIYSITVTDANGCTATTSVAVELLSTLSASVSSSDVSCNGGNDGTLSVAASGGVAPYTYLWSNGATDANVLGSVAGAYSVVVTDVNGCTATVSSSISEPDALSLSASSNDVSCNGANDGSASANVSGGTAPYNYAWNNGATSSSIQGLSAGDYSVTVTDANGCSAVEQASVTEPIALSASASSTNVNCNGASSGSLSASASGGTAPYSYQWSNGATSASVSGISAGNYGVTITDANGCIATASASVSEPVALVPSAIAVDASCYGVNNGSVDLSVSGGTGVYDYAWSNGATTEDIFGLSTGNYAVTVTDANGCMATALANVGAQYAIETSIFTMDVNCSGGNDGSVSLVVAGGSTPYSYLWSNGGTDDNISNLSAGAYSVVVTDMNGCSASSFTSVSEPAALSLSLSNTPEGCDLGDGTASADVSGGTAPYNYQWSDGGTAAIIGTLAVGTYSVTVTDANGCSISGSTEVVYDCNGCAYITVDANDFETGWGIWNDGGNDCALVSNSSVASSGTNVVQLRDNSGQNSATTTNSLDLTNYSELTVSFSYLAVSMDTWREDFWLQISMDGGATFTTIEEWNLSDEFQNDIREYDQVIIPGPFSSATQLRFVCDASGNNDWVYLDDVIITGCFENQPVPTCEDGIQNGDETGIDCGGSNCLPCALGCAYTDIDVNDFEGRLGIWSLGGSDASVSNNTAYSNSGTNSIQLRDNTSSSVLTSSTLDLTAYEELTIGFSYFPVSMDNSNEDFWLQISSNGGSSFTTFEEWNQGDEFINNQRYNEQVIIPGPFTANTQLRFRCDASGNSDWVYIDDVAISGCFNANARLAQNNEPVLEEGEITPLIIIEVKDELRMFPNPAVNEVNLIFDSSTDQKLQLVVSNMFGQVVYEENKTMNEGENRMKLDFANMADGVYAVTFVGNDTKISQRLIIQR